MDEKESMEFASESKSDEGEEKSDVEELKAVSEILLPKVIEIIDKLKEVIKEGITTFASIIDGRKLAQEVSEMYRELKQSGLPEDIINEMIREFYRKKLEIAPSLTEVIKAISEALTARKGEVIVRKEIERERKEEGKTGERKEES